MSFLDMLETMDDDYGYGGLLRKPSTLSLLNTRKGATLPPDMMAQLAQAQKELQGQKDPSQKYLPLALGLMGMSGGLLQPHPRGTGWGPQLGQGMKGMESGLLSGYKLQQDAASQRALMNLYGKIYGAQAKGEHAPPHAGKMWKHPETGKWEIMPGEKPTDLHPGQMIGMELFGQPDLTKLTQQQMALLNKTAKERGIEFAGGKAGATAEARLPYQQELKVTVGGGRGGKEGPPDMDWFRDQIKNNPNVPQEVKAAVANMSDKEASKVATQYATQGLVRTPEAVRKEGVAGEAKLSAGEDKVLTDVKKSPAWLLAQMSKDEGGMKTLEDTALADYRKRHPKKAGAGVKTEDPLGIR